MNLRPILLFIIAVSCVASEAAAQQSVARQWNEQMLSAIRRNVPNPPGHARNLHHAAVAMYDAWAAYDATAVGYLYNEKVSPLPNNVEAARNEAISYAAYRVLRARFNDPQVGFETSLASFDNLLTNMGYSTTTAQVAITNGTSPAEVGKRIGQLVLTWGVQDGFTNTTFPQAYTATVNPNMALPISVLGTNSAGQFNMQLGRDLPLGTNPNLWQPLMFETTSFTQNGIFVAPSTQGFVGVQSLATLPFSLTRADPTKPWIDPFGGPSKLGTASDAAYKANFMDTLRKGSVLNDQTIINISPGAIGNNPLNPNPAPTDPNASDTGTGYATNPVTAGTYAVNNVKLGDYARVLAEYWADGPDSETPPGHWHVIANQVADLLGANGKKIRGQGPVVSALEWDVKTYLSVSGATHDAACASWSLKRYYSGTRPITAIRYMCSKGQSSIPADTATYHAEGIPLETDLVEVITATTTAPGGKHEQIWNVATNSYQSGSSHLGKIAIKSWPGEDPNNPGPPNPATIPSSIRWMLGKDWLPFQRKTFNTPAFPGYISGHSTFSRAAAEALTLITGSSYFPGGFHHRTISANSLTIDAGPSAAVDLQWASYYDAADQAGQSRRYGGIHPYEDDFHGRLIGSTAGISAFFKAEKFWTGNIQSESIQPVVTLQQNGNALLSWPQVLGRTYRIQRSSNFTTWTNVGKGLFSIGATGTYTDVGPAAGSVYRIIETVPSAGRVWNELLMGAIRRNVPNPPAHARNIFHSAAAMYNAWAAYNSSSVGYLQNEKIIPLPGNVEAARHEAISYAAYRVLHSRFFTGAGFATSLASFDAQMTAFGYSTITAQAALTTATTPAELGKRCGQAILDWGATDGFTNTGYPQAYTNTVNPNIDLVPLAGGTVSKALSVLGNNGEFPSRSNMPLGVGMPIGVNPNFWQPLALSTSVTQNGIPTAGGIQTFVGVQGLSTWPFSLTRTDPVKPWLDPFGGPSLLSLPGAASATDAACKQGALGVIRASSELNDPTLIDISPGGVGNNSLGFDNGIGSPTNPITGQPYPQNLVSKGDYYRVLAEYWADGPNSETPPGHWQVLASEIADDTDTVKKIRGAGPIVNDLEWDVKTYFTVASATHDAACAAWALKRYYSGARPITIIRYMGGLGQSSNPSGPAYHSQGLPLENEVCEVITGVTADTGGKHESIWSVYTQSYEPGTWHIGEIAVKSWPGEHLDNQPAPSVATNQSTVRWMLAKDWVPFQRKTFNTPAFPGYISGHSTFSRAAAEALTLITGSVNFPGGFHNYTVAANSLQIDLGPSVPVDLQWRTYYDAADQAGQSRRWGGIHVSEDDYHGRIIGSQAGISAATLAFKYFDGSIMNEAVVPQLKWNPNGSVTITAPARRGLYYLCEFSTNLQTWTPLASSTRALDTTFSVTDTPPTGQRRFYRTRWLATGP